MKRAIDATGLPDAVIREHMIQDGPPFLFASVESVSVGMNFELAGQLFTVIRMCGEQEFLDYRARRGLSESFLGARPQYFFEAATD